MWTSKTACGRPKPTTARARKSNCWSIRMTDRSSVRHGTDTLLFGAAGLHIFANDRLVCALGARGPAEERADLVAPGHGVLDAERDQLAGISGFEQQIACQRRTPRGLSAASDAHRAQQGADGQGQIPSVASRHVIEALARRNQQYIDGTQPGLAAVLRWQQLQRFVDALQAFDVRGQRIEEDVRQGMP